MRGRSSRASRSRQILDRAPGNDAPIGGIKVIAAGGWFAARPSGTEEIYKIYGESFRDAAHLQQILADAQRIVDAALAPVATPRAVAPPVRWVGWAIFSAAGSTGMTRERPMLTCS